MQFMIDLQTFLLLNAQSGRQERYRRSLKEQIYQALPRNKAKLDWEVSKFGHFAAIKRST
jgi:hypothetical protein